MIVMQTTGRTFEIHLRAVTMAHEAAQSGEAQ